MNEIASHALDTGQTPAGVYTRWRAEPKYRLNNLAGDPTAWRWVDLDELELVAFDQCVVFGATFPGTVAELAAAARRDAVVRQARDLTWAAYRAYARRASVERRVRFARELGDAVETGTGSTGSLLPVAMCDGDAAVVATALTQCARVAAAAPA